MKFIFLLLFALISRQLFGQNDRVHDVNFPVWVQSFNTVSLPKKWSLHLEYQWRRTRGLEIWQQSLLRIGAGYQLNGTSAVQAGYGWIETFPYGGFPLAPDGPFPEHRLYEQITFRQPVSRILFTHRIRTEQRWLGRVKPGTAGHREIEEWIFLHRFRYQFRMQYPFLTKNEKQVYAAAADEVFIGAGKNLGVNIFDQNRLFLLAGYKVSKQLSFETGYFNQTLVQGKRVNNRTIVQRNRGWIFTSIIHL